MVIYLCFKSIAFGAFHLRVKDLKFALYQGSRFLIGNVSSYTGNQGRLATAFSWRMDKGNVQTPLICKLATAFTLSMFQGAFANIDLENGLIVCIGELPEQTERPQNQSVQIVTAKRVFCP